MATTSRYSLGTRVVPSVTLSMDVGKPVAEANARRLLDAGVDQFTSNTPVALRNLLEKDAAS